MSSRRKKNNLQDFGGKFSGSFKLKAIISIFRVLKKSHNQMEWKKGRKLGSIKNGFISGNVWGFNAGLCRPMCGDFNVAYCVVGLFVDCVTGR
jgi:hypothetical protein